MEWVPARRDAAQLAAPAAAAGALVHCSVTAQLLPPLGADVDTSAAADEMASPAAGLPGQDSVAAAVPAEWCAALAALAEAGEEALLLQVRALV